MIRPVRAILLAFVLAGLAGCGSSSCPKGGCPAPQPAPAPAGPINAAELIAGFEAGGSGTANLTIPDFTDFNVKVDCGAVTVKKDKPEAGQTQIEMSCTFSMIGVSGNADIKIIIDKDGKGSISTTGKAKILYVRTENINAYIDLTGGSQSGKTVTVKASLNGQCFTATLTRDGDKIIAEVSNPATKIEISKK